MAISKPEQYEFLPYWDNKRYPSLVYVETTNYCNAHCTFCLYGLMERPVEYMSVDQFKFIADKVKSRGILICAMFCFGEPLADPTLFEKIEYARQIGVMPPVIGFNTNVSLLTPRKWPKILKHMNSITLSFMHVGKEFERMTKLSWDRCYKNAIGFIKFRDRHRPEFVVAIGCNDLTGHNRQAVARAFAGYNVRGARDAEVRWWKPVIEGVIDRSIMYHNWRCDAHKGALQIKPNGDCCFCAYDVIKSETKFANIFEDDWNIIEQNFKRAWRKPQELCKRCDYWHNYHQMVRGGWRRGPHIDSSWQDVYYAAAGVKRNAESTNP